MSATTAAPKSIDDVLAEARHRIVRVNPEVAMELLQEGGLLIDIRPQHQRKREGDVPNAIVIERNVLEWRVDPQSSMLIPQVRDYEQPVIILCSEGYTSSLAAASLQELGFVNATDVIGGFHAWQAAGLPTQPGARPPIP